LIIGATIQGFILALFTSSVSLFYLSLGIIGYLKDNISIIERGLLIASAVIMAFVPLNLSPQGIIPLLVGAAIVILHSIKKKG